MPVFPGIEGLHGWIPPGESVPAVTLGLVKDLDTDAQVWPAFKLRRISGLFSLGDPQDVRDNKVGQDGEIPRLGRRRGKTVVYEGTIKGRTRRELLEGRDALIAAFQDMTSEGQMVGYWHPDNTDFDDLEPRYFKGRALTCEVMDEQINQKHERLFVLSIRMSEPKFFLVDDDSLVGV